MRHFILLGALASLCGCAALPGSLAETDPVPSGRLYAPAGKADGQVVVYNDGQGISDTCLIRLTVDGKPAADVSRGEIAYLALTIGKHRLQAEPRGRCADAQVQSAELQLKAGDALVWRVGSNERVPAASGEVSQRAPDSADS